MEHLTSSSRKININLEAVSNTQTRKYNIKLLLLTQSPSIFLF